MAMPEQNAADTERTTLSGERTLLAWWRTGLASIAVGIAIGRLVPELNTDNQIWPYTVVGASYAVYGIALIIYGSVRGREVESAARRGSLSNPSAITTWVMAVGAVALGIGTLGLIIFG
jgi:uncharacterized membrane protein YidH (DUF202 family)